MLKRAVMLLAVAWLHSCAPCPAAEISLHTNTFTASWERFTDTGKIAKNGQPFNPRAFTCASRHYPIGTVLRITEIHNGSTVIVTVTDVPAQRYAARLDLSPAAFKKLDGLEFGLCEVRAQVMK